MTTISGKYVKHFKDADMGMLEGATLQRKHPMTETLTAILEEREPITHELKTWESYFHAIFDGTKPFEIRRDDRDFRVGDRLLLRETYYHNGEYTGREVERRITYILRHEPEFGLMEGFAILGVKVIQKAQS